VFPPTPTDYVTPTVLCCKYALAYTGVWLHCDPMNFCSQAHKALLPVNIVVNGQEQAVVTFCSKGHFDELMEGDTAAGSRNLPRSARQLAQRERLTAPKVHL
jgi:hypothetical protein